MITNNHIDLKSIRIHKVIPSSIKRNGLPVSAQVIFLCWEGFGRTGRVTVQRSQTFHVRLESDGNYHWRGTKRGLNAKGEAVIIQVHNVFEPSDLTVVRKVLDLPEIAVAA